MAALAQTTALNPFAGYVAIAPDGTVTVYSAHMDMGQGIYHGIATLVNEELMADWAKIRSKGDRPTPPIMETSHGAAKFKEPAARPESRHRLIATAPRAPRRD